MRQLSKQNSYLNQLTPLIEFLETPSLSPEALANFLVLRTFSQLDAEVVYFDRLDKDKVVRLIASYGMKPEVENEWREFSFDLDLPPCDAIKSNKIIWLAEPEDWLSLYPQLAQRSLDNDRPTHICVPISVAGGASGTIGIALKQSIKQDKTNLGFISAVAGLVSLYFTSIYEGAADSSSEYLSPRQMKILHLIYEGLTNNEIADKLGFSDSTIRQESMRIYQILKVTGRKEAIKVAIERNLINNQAS